MLKRKRLMINYNKKRDMQSHIFFYIHNSVKLKFIDLLITLYYNFYMKEKRYFYNDILTIGKTIILDGDEFHHLSNVMRSRIGERVCLFNGDGTFYFGNVKTIAKKHAEIDVTEKIKSESEPEIELSVYQALAKGDKLSLIMQKITEIGASELCLFESKFCDVKSNTHKQERMDSIAISASKQCGRASITKSSGIFTIKQIAEQIRDFDAFYVAYENKDGLTLVSDLENNKSSLKKVAIMIGAEGGFSEEEINLLEESGAKIVSLGKRILRTETASIVSAGIIMQILENK